MIINAFDNQSKAIINPCIDANAPQVEACILTFSHEIEKFVLDNYDCKEIGAFWFATGRTPIYVFNYEGYKFAFYKTYVGAPSCVGTVEETLSLIKTNKYIVFGGAGCLNKEIARGKVMVPTEAYRDEGTSYHYAPASDYIEVKNADIVATFMKISGLPFVKGKTWTTDAIFRETVNNFEKRKADGCISVEMECAALQAVCDFRGLNLYVFFTSGDLLDSPKWDMRLYEDKNKGTQHDVRHFHIALELARYVAEKC
ncbi:MAG: nucleoside phosphorylase [Lachnospiraceae bacterium]|nr:nucleoside phosphorylase [Lachnospiraceae bacterium]